jgi:hypothetical protein
MPVNIYGMGWGRELPRAKVSKHAKARRQRQAAKRRKGKR